MAYKFGKRSLDNLAMVHPKMVTLMMEAIKESPVDFTIVCGHRTASEQKALYAKGRTEKGPIVTSCDGVIKISKHQSQEDGYSHAVDIYPFFNGQVQVNHTDTVKCLKQIAAHIKKVAEKLNIQITWLGDHKMRDYPHFELKNV